MLCVCVCVLCLVSCVCVCVCVRVYTSYICAKQSCHMMIVIAKHSYSVCYYMIALLLTMCAMPRRSLSICLSLYVYAYMCCHMRTCVCTII